MILKHIHSDTFYRPIHKQVLIQMYNSRDILEFEINSLWLFETTFVKVINVLDTKL